ADRRRGRGGTGRGRLGRMTETGVSPEILVGPMLRYVDRTDATVWVEVSRPCRVTIRAGGCEAVEDSWGVHGHHFALLHLSGLESGRRPRIRSSSTARRSGHSTLIGPA